MNTHERRVFRALRTVWKKDGTRAFCVVLLTRRNGTEIYRSSERLTREEANELATKWLARRSIEYVDTTSGAPVEITGRP